MEEVRRVVDGAPLKEVVDRARGIADAVETNPGLPFHFAPDVT